MANYTLKAIAFATKKHEGQTRKVSGMPYILHPLSVATLVSTYKTSKNLDQMIAATILHDTLEDTDTTFKELARNFTPLTCSLVLELTDSKDDLKLIGKVEYQKKKWCAISSYALTIKLCDRLHNLSDHPTEQSLIDTKEILEHVKRNRKLTGTQKNLIKEIFTITKTKLV